MSVIPFASVGAVIGHMMMGWSILTASILGLIALAGVVVNSSLVLVDYANRQRRMGADAYTAAHRSAVVRFRPIVITSITTFAGLLPLMLNTNPATVFVVPMAISLAWGVVFATVITLFLVPCCYLILEGFLPRRRSGSSTATDRADRVPPVRAGRTQNNCERACPGVMAGMGERAKSLTFRVTMCRAPHALAAATCMASSKSAIGGVSA